MKNQPLIYTKKLNNFLLILALFFLFNLLNCSSNSTNSIEKYYAENNLDYIYQYINQKFKIKKEDISFLRYFKNYSKNSNYDMLIFHKISKNDWYLYFVVISNNPIQEIKNNYFKFNQLINKIGIVDLKNDFFSILVEADLNIPVKTTRNLFLFTFNNKQIFKKFNIPIIDSYISDNGKRIYNYGYYDFIQINTDNYIDFFIKYYYDKEKKKFAYQEKYLNTSTNFSLIN